MNQLDNLRKFTTIVADTSNFNSIKEFSPTDVTTNPTLIYKSIQEDEYKDLFQEIIKKHLTLNLNKKQLTSYILNQTSIEFGKKILQQIPGRVSIEIDPILSFDSSAIINQAQKIIRQFQKDNFDTNRILIKIVATWEGIQAATILQKKGINCNMTLIFSLEQAIICAQSKIKIISPFIGRINDWFKKNNFYNNSSQDPGVELVYTIHRYYQKFNYSTQIMGASFRNKNQILDLCGCDFLTISTRFLEELKSTKANIVQKLFREENKTYCPNNVALNEKEFRWLLNKNQMAIEKISEGINLFHKDWQNLKNIIFNTI